MTQKITSMVLSIVSCLSAFLFIFTALPVSAADDAVFVSQSVPTTMETGKTYSVWVKIKNSGTTTWSAALSYRLGAQNLQDNAKWGFNRVYLGNSDSIAPGATKTFYFAVTAPATAGTYHFQWRMVREYISWFGDYSIDKTVWVADSATVDLMARIKTKGCMGDGLLYSGYEGSKNNDDVIALVNGSGCQYVHRAIDTWPAPPDFSLIQSRMAKITKTDMAYDMFISEGISTTAVYYYPDENRNFDMAAMCVPGSASTFGASSCVPSYRSEEYRKYLRYITRKAIDLGIQSFTFGQVYMSDIDMSNPVLPMIANEIRQYGASKGRAVVVGGQTNDLADESYLRSLDYGVGGLGIDSQGNIESGSCLSTVTNFCWALLFNEPWILKFNNLIFHHDWGGGSTNEDSYVFVQLPAAVRAQSLQNTYAAFMAKGVGLLLPYRMPLAGNNVCGVSGGDNWYTPDNDGRCQDEDVMNSILGVAQKTDGNQCATDGECSSGNCADGGTCCAAGKCGWGEYPNTECVADGAKKSNEYLNGICRAGTWKAAAGGIGCNSFTCDSGTCTENKCMTTGCTSECSASGVKQCSGNGYQTCGNYDADSCLEWSSVTACAAGEICSGGACQATVSSAANLSVYEAILENQGCGGNGVAHYLCRASRYCANQGYVAGFETEWGVPAVVSCVKGKKLLVSYATLENQGCGGDVDGLPHLSCRASRYCASKGYISGFQTEWGTSAAVVCVK